MEKWQKYWLCFLLGYSGLHLVRDILQDSGVRVFLTTELVKHSTNPALQSIIWDKRNTYVIALTEIVLALICLKRNRFGWLGLVTVIVAVVTLLTWSWYWFLL